MRETEVSLVFSLRFLTLYEVPLRSVCLLLLTVFFFTS
jgi:hypothetical protein